MLYTYNSCPDTNNGSNLLNYCSRNISCISSFCGKGLSYSYSNIKYFSLISFIILQSKPAIGLFISANLIINCSFYGLATQVIPTGTEHLTGQMIKHSLLQIAKGH